MGIVKAAAGFKVGDRVRHKDTGEEGKVQRVEYHRYFVTWDSGKTWIYPGIDLELV